MPRCLVALGSNLGDRAGAVAAAIQRLAELDTTAALRASRLRETPPIGGPQGQGPYLNAAVAFDSGLTAQGLHAALLEIETALGRRRGERWAARAIDLDLLLYGDEVIDTPALSVPHPRMAFRRFVLEPAVEVAAEMTHPTIGWSVARLLAHLDTAAPYLALLGMPGAGKSALASRLATARNGRFISDPATHFPQSGTAGPPDAAGQAYAREIEFLALRAGVLDKRLWPAGGVLAASDFYFEQSLAYAETTLAPDALGALCEAMDAARRQVVLPKLLVVLDTPPSRRIRAEDMTPDDAPAGHPSQDTVRADQLRDRLLDLAMRRGVGPVLYVDAPNPDAQFAEVSAAFDAMQTQSQVS